MAGMLFVHTTVLRLRQARLWISDFDTTIEFSGSLRPVID